MMHHWSIALKTHDTPDLHYLSIAVPDDIEPAELLDDLEMAEAEVYWMIKVSPVLPAAVPN